MTPPDQTTPAQSAAADKPRSRRMARPADVTDSCVAMPRPPRGPSKFNQIEALLLRPEGASIVEMIGATGWQQHSLRGAIAGALKKRGLTITSNKADGVRHYHASREV